MAPSNLSEGRFLLLTRGSQALDARIGLIRQAGRQIKLQSYIWHEDYAGRLIARELIRAADRRVQIQILLDDFNTSNELPLFRTLNAHPYINIHLFNPIPKLWRQSFYRWLLLVWEIRRLNRRMHNKVLIVDNQWAIVGGRNIGDEYFDRDPGFNFFDLDLLCCGPLVAQLSESFDQYWHHPYAKPIKRWFRAQRKRHFRRRIARLRQKVFDYRIETGLETLSAGMFAATAEVVCDRPDNFGNSALIPPPKEVARRLRPLLAGVRESLIVQSAYLMLSDDEIELLGRLRANGVSVKLLTNSLATTDVLVNHAGFSNTRRAMLRNGLEFRELAAVTKSPKMGLHGKALVIDHRLLFLGSYNLTKRSALLNTETVLIVNHPELARQVEDSILSLFESSWRPELRADNTIVWQRAGDRGVRIGEPDAGFWLRLLSRLLSCFSLSRYF
jgi:putative cardiolipin synthase